MKKIILPFLLMFVCSTVLFVACKKESTTVTKTQTTIDVRLAKDAVFENTLNAAANLSLNLNIASLSNDRNIIELEKLGVKINNKTATTADYAKVQQIVGISYQDFIVNLQKFGLALGELNKKYPELSKMNQADLSATFTKAIKANPKLENFVSNPKNETLRLASCPLRDVCNLAVTLTKIFAGDTICAAINVTTIPVVGGILCQLILNLGVGILTGICNALPC